MFEHTNKQFDINLDYVCSQFLKMGNIVESMIEKAVEVLISGNTSLTKFVRDQEKEVNRFEIEIDEQISCILVCHQPAAIDLRMLLAVSKMLTDMERSGDEAEKIAKTAYRIYKDKSQYIPITELRDMAIFARKMLHQSLSAFEKLDSIQAKAVVHSDKEVDKKWKDILCRLITTMTKDSSIISRATSTIFIARALERIGDHAKNMSERVIYMVEGTDIRHTDINER